MGTKFSVTAVSGYNSSPPADDGTVSASNQVTWASQKTKLTDPIKTAYDANMTALATALNQSAVSLTTNTNLDATYHNKTAEIASTATSGITISLGDAATMAAGYIATVSNQSSYVQTIGRVTGGDTINGIAGNFPIHPGMSYTFVVNAAANGYNVIASGFPKWVTPTFNAGDFTGSGSMTWTVASGDVTTMQYKIEGKTMTVNFFLLTTTVGGSLDQTLNILIPASKTAAKRVRTACYVSDNGTARSSMCEVGASGTTIQIFSSPTGGNWSSATDATAVAGQIVFEIA